MHRYVEHLSTGTLLTAAEPSRRPERADERLGAVDGEGLDCALESLRARQPSLNPVVRRDTRRIRRQARRARSVVPAWHNHTAEDAQPTATAWRGFACIDLVSIVVGRVVLRPRP
jgi:hypothetical protein